MTKRGDNGAGAAPSAALRDLLPSLSLEERAEVFAGLGPDELDAVLHDWRGVWARPEQVPPDSGDWTVFLYLAGRGAGKTRAAAEWVRAMALRHTGCRISIVARTAGDVRDVCVEGESGLLAVHPASERPAYSPATRRLAWPNGTIATTFSADEPDLLRGPQSHFAWCDEIATWTRADETWSNLRLGLRLGAHPRCMVTTTPRPIALLRELLAAPTTIVRRGSTYSNAANLAPSALAEFRRLYEGTRLGRAELHGELLEDVPGALWNRATLDASRVKEAPELVRVVVAVDPAVSSGPDSDETGIVAAGKSRDGHLYVLRDASLRGSPDAWARRAVALFDELGADRVVAEKNQGGAMVEAVLRTVRPALSLELVHASRGKLARAEPVAALYEQGRVHHVGVFEALEDQLCTYSPETSAKSPDRMDALVWAVTALSGGAVVSFGGPRPPSFTMPRRW